METVGQAISYLRRECDEVGLMPKNKDYVVLKSGTLNFKYFTEKELIDHANRDEKKHYFDD